MNSKTVRDLILSGQLEKKPLYGDYSGYVYVEKKFYVITTFSSKLVVNVLPPIKIIHQQKSIIAAFCSRGKGRYLLGFLIEGESLQELYLYGCRLYDKDGKIVGKCDIVNKDMLGYVVRLMKTKDKYKLLEKKHNNLLDEHTHMLGYLELNQ